MSLGSLASVRLHDGLMYFAGVGMYFVQLLRVRLQVLGVLVALPRVLLNLLVDRRQHSGRRVDEIDMRGNDSLG